MTDSTPPPMPDFPPPPPTPKRPRNWVVISSAAAVIATVIGTGVFVVNSRDDKDSNASSTTAAETSTPTDDTITPAMEPEPTPENTEPEVMSLTDGVQWDGGIEVELTGWTRGVTGPYAAPESTPFVKFKVTIRNTGTDTVDLSGAWMTCIYGTNGTQSEQVFDSDGGLDGLPQVHLRPGKSVSAPTGCELPKDEEYLQVEMVPMSESEVAIFAGNVK
ncbi:DUF4352 domain-containing protein [Streptomyces chartreusis]|uniref:DUF4352 domain-containing protein n=1 Tax=Streptomyces chartreusis TaxID=1969 RepID=UPI00369B1FC8